MSLQELQDLEDIEVENVEEPAQKPLQKIKIKKGEKPVTEDVVKNDEPLVKQKKPKTEKQLEVFARAREKMLTNLKERKEKKALEEAQLKKELEEKIVQKAIAIKKKQIKKKAVLDIVSDDDTSIEEVKKLAMREKPAVMELPPKTIFEKYRFI
jgi:hypothetical protein